MSSIASLVGDRVSSRKLIVLVALSLALPFIALAQQGQDAVYNSSGQVTNSPAFIDASMFASSVQNPNLCSVLNWVLNPQNHILPSAGAVIDARGLPGNTGTSMTCTASPWAGITNPLPSTILLPAGTIVIPTTWVLPSNTRLVGEGEGIPSSTFAPGTTIQAPSGTLLSTMIQFGSSSPSVCGSSGVCSGTSVEQLTLDGKAQAVHGIVNQFSQTNTYVDHVTLYQILGTGLLISSSGSSSATNSGPYTNITFDTGGYPGASSTMCAQIIGTSGTRGIHGLRCKSESNDAQAAVLLDSSNNSIEDVNIVGFYDGILVGSQASAQSNVLLNIVGDTAAGNVAPVNVVHISGNKPVTDLSIMGVINVVAPANGQNSIKDDVTSTTLGDTNVAIYALGESPGSGGGYSRFTTSLNAAHWTVGTAAPPSNTTCARGSLYSCTNGRNGNLSCSNALWVCGPSGWIVVK